MPDLEISNLPSLAEASVQATDPIAIADLSASETKKVTVKDLIEAGVSLIDAASIPAAKVGTLGTNQVATAAIQDLAVTTAKIANGAITVTQITDATITGAKLVNDTITATQIAANAIGASELADDAVDTAAIASNAITNVKINNGEIVYAKLNISDGDIPGAKITGNSITSAQIATNGVTATELANNAVDTAAIVSGAVTSAKIASNTIVAGNIGAGAITSSELAANSVTTSQIADGAVTAAKLSGTLAATSIADDAVTTAKIVDDAVTSAKLAANAVDATALADNAVDSGAIASNAVTEAKIAANAVVNAKIADGTITAAKLATGNIDRSLNVASGNLGINNAVTGGASNRSGITYNAQGLITATTALIAGDLPVSSATAVGGASFPTAGGLAITGAGAVSIAATVTGTTRSGITFNNFGQITASTALVSGDLPNATASATGAVSVPTGGPLSISGAGALTVSNSGVTAGTGTKVTVDAKGIVTALTNIAAGDLPSHSAALLTSGSVDAARIGTDSITGSKLANASTTLFGSVAQTGFPTSEFTGQFFFDSVSEDLYIYDGNAYQPVTTLTKGSLVFGGTFNASTSKVASVTTAGAAAGLSVGSNVPTPTTSTDGIYLVVENAGTPSAPAPVVALAPPDYILGVTNTSGSSWEEIDLSQTVAGQVASNITFTPFGQLQSTNVQDALEEVETEKLGLAGGTLTGQMLLGNTATLVFEGSSTDAYQTTLGVVNPTTADKTILLPNTSGTLITTNDSGTVTSAMIAAGAIVNADINASAAIALTKLEGITAGRLIVGNGSGVAAQVAVTGDISINNAGLTAIASGVIVDSDISGSAAITGTKIATGTTSAVGVLQLTDSAASTSTSTAATPAAVKVAKDAADAAATTANAALPKAGGIMTDHLTIDNGKELRLSEADSDGAHYSGFKAQAQAADITYTLPASAPTTGQVLKSGSTATTLEWATDSATDATKLPLAGGTMSGAIAMGTSKITGLGDPTAAQDAATKTYVDTADNSKLNLSGGSLTGNLTLNAQSDVRFADSDSSHYIALQASGTIASSFTLTLPATDAAVSGYVLASDGSGTLSWVDPGSSSSPTFTGDATLTNDGALVGFASLNATYTGNVKTLTVTVASKTAAHRYYGSGSSSGYKIGGKESPFLTLTPGRTYKFDQADNSNSGHPLRFYLEADKTTAYTTGVTTSGTAGSAGAYTQIVVSDTTPQILHYQCSSHASMGNSVQANSNIASTAKTLATARTIGGVSFDGSAAINLPGVNTAGNQNTTGTSGGFTAGNASNLDSGTVNVARLGSGSSVTTKFLRGDNSWQTISATPEGTAILSTGESGGTKFLREDGDGTCSWQAISSAAAGSLTGSTLASGVTASSLTSVGTLTGLTVDGDLNLNGASYHVVWDKSDNALEFTDNAKATFGADADLSIYHDGSHSYISDTGTGDLVIKGSNVNIYDGSNKSLFYGVTDGSASLYHNNSKKFETSSTGATITGTATATTFSGSGASLTALNASNISSGTIAAARVATLNQNTTGSSGSCTGNAATATNASGLTGSPSITCTNVSDSKGNVRTIVQNSQGTYTLVAADAGKHILATGTITIPTGVLSTGDAVTIVNSSGSNITLTASVNTLYNTADAATGNRTLAARGMATILFTSTNTAYISGAGLS